MKYAESSHGGAQDRAQAYVKYAESSHGGAQDRAQADVKYAESSHGGAQDRAQADVKYADSSHGGAQNRAKADVKYAESSHRGAQDHGGILNGGVKWGELCKDGWRAYIVNITSSRRTVRLGSLQGIYERFQIRNLIR